MPAAAAAAADARPRPASAGPSAFPRAGAAGAFGAASAVRAAADIRFAVKKATVAQHQQAARPASALQPRSSNQAASAGAHQAELNALRRELTGVQRELTSEKDARLEAEAALSAAELSAAATHEKMSEHYALEEELRRQLATATKSNESQRKLLTERNKQLTKELQNTHQELLSERKRHQEGVQALKIDLSAEKQAHVKATELTKKLRADKRNEAQRADAAADQARIELRDDVEDTRRQLANANKEVEALRIEIRDTQSKFASASRLHDAELARERSATREALARLEKSKNIDPREHIDLKNRAEHAEQMREEVMEKRHAEALAYAEKIREVESQVAALRTECAATAAAHDAMRLRLLDEAKQVLLERAESAAAAAAVRLERRKSIGAPDPKAAHDKATALKGGLSREALETKAERLAEENAQLLARIKAVEKETQTKLDEQDSEMRRLRLYSTKVGKEARHSFRAIAASEGSIKETAEIADARRRAAEFEARLTESQEIARAAKTSEWHMMKERDEVIMRNMDLTTQLTKLERRIQTAEIANVRVKELEARIKSDYIQREFYEVEKDEKTKLQAALRSARDELVRRTAAVTKGLKEKEETSGVLQQAMLKNVSVMGENDKLLTDNRRLHATIERLKRALEAAKGPNEGGGGIGAASNADGDVMASVAASSVATMGGAVSRMNPATATQEIQRLTAALDEARTDAKRAKRQGELKAERLKRALDEANGKLGLLQDDVAGRMRERLESLEAEHAGVLSELAETRNQLAETSADARAAKDTLAYVRSRHARKLAGLGVSAVSNTALDPAALES